MSGKNRADIQISSLVDVILKKDQKTGQLTRGRVKRILTNSAYHPHGIKVELDSGKVGRVQNIFE